MGSRIFLFVGTQGNLSAEYPLKQDRSGADQWGAGAKAAGNHPDVPRTMVEHVGIHIRFDAREHRRKEGEHLIPDYDQFRVEQVCNSNEGLFYRFLIFPHIFSDQLRHGI